MNRDTRREILPPRETLGDSDELGFSPIGERMDIHDLHTTILKLLGIDHTKLT